MRQSTFILTGKMLVKAKCDSQEVADNILHDLANMILSVAEYEKSHALPENYLLHDALEKAYSEIKIEYPA